MYNLTSIPTVQGSFEETGACTNRKMVPELFKEEKIERKNSVQCELDLSSLKIMPSYIIICYLLFVLSLE